MRSKDGILRRLLGVFLLLGLFGCEDSTGPTTPSPSCHQYELFTHWVARLPIDHGAANPIIDGDVAFVLSGSEVQMIDVANPEKPRFRASVGVGDDIRKLVVRDGFAYIVSPNVLYVLDVRDAANPMILGNEVFSEGIRNLAAHGDYVYLIVNTGLHAIDVRDPMNPRRVGTLAIPNAWSIDIFGKHAYVGSFPTNDIAILDLTDPANPRFASSVQIGSYVTDLEISENRLYASADSRDLYVFDLGHPLVPRMLDHHTTRHWYGDIEVAGDRIYNVLHRAVEVFHASPRGHLTALGTFRTPDYFGAAGLAVRGEQVMVGGAEGLHFYAVPTGRSLDANRPIGGGTLVMDVAASGGFLFAATRSEQNLPTIEVLDAASRAVVGRLFLAEAGESIAISGSHAYVETQASGIYVLDISIPTVPTVVGHMATPGNTQRVALDGLHAYIVHNATGRSGLQIVDVTNPAAPHPVSELTIPWTALNIVVQDHYAYVAAFEGLYVIDIADAAAPRLVTMVTTQGGGSLVVEGTQAYLGHGSLEIFDLSNPEAPARIAEITAPYQFFDIAVAGDIAYLTEAFLGVVAFDVSDPFAPKAVGMVGADSGRRIIHHQNQLFVAEYGISFIAPQCDAP